MSNRRNNYIKNVSATILLQLINPICAFITRIVFTHVLNADYLGPSGLFSDILSILSLSELGLGGAVTFALYKPIAQNDTDKMSAIMHFLRKAYFVIGWVILGIGLAICPFLTHIVKWDSSLDLNIYVVFMLFILNSAVSYWFFSYRQVLLTAAQKLYKMQLVQVIFSFVQVIISSAVLLIARNYILYLVGTIVVEIIQSCVISAVTQKAFPGVFGNKHAVLDSSETKSMWKNVYSVFIGNVSYQIFTSTDSIIISSVINTAAVGILSNYRLIIRTITSFSTLFTSSMLPAIGDIVASEEPAVCKKTFFKFNLIQMWMTSLMAICVLTCAHPFILTFFGMSYLESNIVLIILLWNFWSDLSMTIVWHFRAAYGLYTYGKYARFIGALINIPLSFYWADKFGVAGVLFATSICNSPSLTYPYYVFVHGFKSKASEYYKVFLKHLVITGIAGAAAFLLTGFSFSNSFLTLVVRLVISFVVTNILFIVFYMRNENFKYAVEEIRKLISKFTDRAK